MRVSRRRAVRIILLLLCLPALIVLPGHAVETVNLSLGSLEGEGWSLDDISVQLAWAGESGVRAELHAGGARLPGQLGTADRLQLVCAAVEISASVIDCPQGTLRLRSGRFGSQSLKFSLHYRFADRHARVGVRNFRLGDGRVAMTVDYRDGDWSADVQATGVALSAVAAELAAFDIALPTLILDGSLDLDARLHGQGARLLKSGFEARLKADSFSDKSGRYAGENLDVLLTGNVRARRSDWRVRGDLSARQGAVYIDPVYVEVTGKPIRSSADLTWSPRTRVLSLHAFDYLHPGSVRLNGEGTVDLRDEQPVRALKVTVQDAIFPSVYKYYLQPWVVGTLAGNMETLGRLGGSLEIADGAPVRASLGVEALQLNQLDGLFGFDGMTGQLDWSDTATPEYSTLAWDAGHVYRVALGASQLELESTGNAVLLMRPVRIPVLDGALDIDSFSLDYAADKALRWAIDAILTPISMQQLTRALEWPEFGGKLSGVIPAVRYADGELTVGGVLLVRVFDGVVTLRDLTLEQPFGLVPRLSVNAAVDNIDLETLTGTFEFGRIEGRLDGRVDGLLLESWRPVAFDAEFATPPDDKSRHRISQKAVDNISNIGGGGVGGALSRTFLGFFEEFPYARLGIRCRLRNGVCDMGGVEPAASGYYLVKGTFLPPRLDVVGFANRVNWDSLVAQIIAVTREKNVVVE